MALIKRYQLKKITCQKCYQKIIDQVNNLDGVISSSIDEENNLLTIKSNKMIDENKIYQLVQEIEEKHLFHEGNYLETTLYFDGVDCINCAGKIENEIKKHDKIKFCQINFISKNISLVYQDDVDIESLVINCGKKVEHDFTLVKSKKNNLLFSKKKPEKTHEIFECACQENHEHTHHEEKKVNNKNYLKIGLIIVSLLFALAASILQFIDQYYYVRISLFVISYLILGKDLIIDTINSFKRKDFFNENTLMLVASLGALIIDEGFESIMVVLLNGIGEYYQNKATNSSKKAIEDLISLEQQEVLLTSHQKVNVEELKVNDRYIIKVGEKIPVDSILLSSEATLDMRSLTGESLPRYLAKGETILSGSINLERVIELEVKKVYQESTISKVKKMIEKANEQKSKSQEFITKFSHYYTPSIMLISLIIFLMQLFVLKNNIYNSLNISFSILVIACPCALVISIPLCYFSGIGKSSKEGILVKGGNYLEALVKLDHVVFDKTGTLTKGEFAIIGISPYQTSQEELLELASKCEIYSNHPLKEAIVKAYGKNIKIDQYFEIEEISGKGIKFTSNQEVILIGNDKMMKENQIDYQVNNQVGTILYVALNGEFKGSIVLGDQIKEETKVLLKYLNDNQITTTMLTGDKEDISKKVADELRIGTYYSELLPDQKYQKLEEIIANKRGSVIYVGDGINDSPSLSLADVGISFGNLGTNIAKESSDVIIMNDDISKIINLIKISKKTRRVIIINIIMILSVKLLALVIGTTGILGSYAILLSIFSDVGVSLISILNSRTILK